MSPLSELVNASQWIAANAINELGWRAHIPSGEICLFSFFDGADTVVQTKGFSGIDRHSCDCLTWCQTKEIASHIAH